MWWLTPPDPDQVDVYGTGGPSNHPHFSNPEMDTVLLEAQKTTDRERRRQPYYHYQELEMADPSAATLYDPKEIRAMNGKLVIPRVGVRDTLLHEESWHHAASRPHSPEGLRAGSGYTSRSRVDMKGHAH